MSPCQDAFFQDFFQSLICQAFGKVCPLGMSGPENSLQNMENSVTQIWKFLVTEHMFAK